jgi:putative ABC transport system permease protein
LATPVGRYDRGDQKQLLIRPILERVKKLPGFVAAAESTSWPPDGWLPTEVTVPEKPNVEGQQTLVELVSEDYFKTLGLGQLGGRLLSETEVDSARHVAVINEALSDRLFAHENPIGQRIKLKGYDKIPYQPPNSPHDPHFEVIGVVTNYRNAGLRNPPVPQVFIPYTITGVAIDRTIMVRAAASAETVLKTLPSVVWAVDPDVGFRELALLASFQQQQYLEPRFELTTLSTFGGIGLLLATIGVFSVMAYTVSWQTHDIGIRMALGAQPVNILGMVLKKGLTLLTAGIVVGIFASLGLTHYLSSQVWGVSTIDPWTFGTVTTVILGVGLMASFLPARNAAKVDPLISLRHE